MSRFTSDALVSAIRRRGSVPETPQTPSDSELVAFLNDAQDLAIVPAILSTKEEFFVATKDYAIGDETEFTLPSRAIGNRVRMIQLVDAQGNPGRQLQRYSPEQGNAFGGNLNSFISLNGHGYYFEANKVVLVGNTPTEPTLRVKYYKRPGYLVQTIEAGQITAIDLGTGEIMLDKNVPLIVAGVTVDVIAQTSPFDNVVEDVEIETAAGFAIEVSPAVAAQLSVGDWVALSGETPIPQFPKDLHPLFVQYALMKVMDSLGKTNIAESATRDFSLLMSNLYQYLDDRDDGSAQIIRSLDGIFDWDDSWYSS